MPVGVYKRKPIPPEVRLKMSLAHKGKVFTPEHRENLRKSMIGRKRSDLSLRLQSERQKGKPSPMKGRKHSEKSKALMTLSQTGRRHSLQSRKKSSETHKRLRSFERLRKPGEPSWNKGMRGVSFHTEESRRKIGESAKLKRGKRSSYCGVSHHWWRGGRNSSKPELMKIRQGLEYRTWRRAVFLRDGWTCQKYKIKGCHIVAHHILNFRTNPNLRFSVDNGITLSREAHLEFHNKCGRLNNTREQLMEFLGE